MKPPDRDFFRRYWLRGSVLRKPYQYQWFLKSCREHAFSSLDSMPRGLVIEVGVGMGSTADDERGPSTYALDLFPELLSPGRGVVADAQRLPLRDSAVVAIWTQTISMHLDLRSFVRETRRVLTKNGALLLIEPLHGNPVLNCLRKVLPARKTHAVYPRLAELERLASLFSQAAVKPFFLISPILLFVPRPPRALVTRLQRLDDRLLQRFPGLRRYAWYAVASFRK